MSSTAIPLIRAAADGDVGAVKEQVAGGADVNARTPIGDTALIRAAFFGHAEVVRVLLAAGADARARDGYDLTAYEWSVRKGFYDVARLLREYAPSEAPDVPVVAAEDQPGPISAREEGGLDAGRSAGRGATAEHGELAQGEADGRGTKPEAMGAPAGPIFKRCPKCDGIYRGEILAYCPRDAVRLVRTDEPPAEADHSDGSRKWVWALVALTLLAGVFIGYQINRYGAEGPTATPHVGGAAVRWEKPVTGGTLKGKEVTLPDPPYKAPAEGEKVTGEVTVEVKVDRTGAVVWARAVSGPPPLQSACVKAALESRFSPGIPTRRATNASGTITYTFK
jgi:TonB family protein